MLKSDLRNGLLTFLIGKATNMKFKASIIIKYEIDAADMSHAEAIAAQWQEDMAGSNDGSEIIANADLTVVPLEK